MTEENHTAHKAILWGAGISTALGLSPYLLPYVVSDTSQITDKVINLCTNSKEYGNFGSGLSGLLNSGLSHVPLVGEFLSSGGWGSALVSGAIGLGGTILGNYVSKHYDRPGQIPWGKIIKYAAITTSLLIALPGLLSGISMGITFLAMAFGNASIASSAYGAMASTFGFMGPAAMGAAGSGIGGLVSQAMCCGAVVLPALSTFFMGGSAKSAEPQMQMVSATPMIAGVPTTLQFQLRDGASGPVIGAEQLKTMHTEKLHTMIVDASLTDYHHVHPRYDPATQLFTCQFTPKQAQPYRAWHDITLASTGKQAYLSNDLPSLTATRRAPIIRQASQVSVAGMQVSIRPDALLRASEDNMVSIDVRGPNGALVNDLQPIMGSYAHLVAFSQDGKHIVHCHPLGAEPASAQDRGTGALRFHITPEVAGGTKFFLQIKRGGQETMIPFGQQVMPSQHFTQRVAHTQHQHGTMAMG